MVGSQAFIRLLLPPLVSESGVEGLGFETLKLKAYLSPKSR